MHVAHVFQMHFYVHECFSSKSFPQMDKINTNEKFNGNVISAPHVLGASNVIIPLFGFGFGIARGMDLEIIQTVGFALLLINTDDLVKLLFDSLHSLFNISQHLTLSDIKWIFTRSVIIIVVLLVLWEFREIFYIHSH